MSTTSLYRLTGLAFLGSVPLWLVGQLIHPRGEELADVLNSNQTASHALLFAAWVLILLGLPAMYARQADRAGRLGLVAFVLMMLTTVFHLYLLAYEAGPMAILSTNPAAPSLFGPGGPVQQGTLRSVAGPASFGPLLYGFVTLRTAVYSRRVGWFLMAWLAVFGLLTVLTGLAGGPSNVSPVPDDLRALIRAAPVPVLGVFISYALLEAGFALAGLELWKMRGHPARQLAPDAASA